MLKVTDPPSPHWFFVCHLFYATTKNATMFYALPPTNFEIYMPPTFIQLEYFCLSNKNSKLRKVYRHFWQAFFIARHLFMPTLFMPPSRKLKSLRHTLFMPTSQSLCYSSYATKGVAYKKWGVA